MRTYESLQSAKRSAYSHCMAIYHCSISSVSRSSGRSAVAAAAYRSGTLLINERDGRVHDYRPRKGIEHRQIVLPARGSAPVVADWAKNRAALWNAAEAAERRKDARVAREVEVSLPHELDAKQRQALATELAQHLANRYQVAVDLAIHSPNGKTDARNHHAHLLMTTRTVTASGLGEKTMLERENRALARIGWPTTHQQVRELRETWADLANRHLARAEHDLRIDHRSHAARGIELTPTAHRGVHATQLSRKGWEVSRAALTVEQAQRNAMLIRDRPERVLAVISAEQRVFGPRDVSRAVHRYTEGAGQFQAVYGRVMASPELVRLSVETRDTAGRVTAPARYSTRDRVADETRRGVSLDRAAGPGGGREVAVSRALARDTPANERRGAVTVHAGDELSALAQAWRGLEQRLDALQGRRDGQAREGVLRELRTIAARIRDDARLREAFLERQRALGVRRGSGLDRAVRERNLDRAMDRIRDRDTERGR
jgi:ATP-dependent exoDNAse (exonuclease V) alpha subunit